MSLKTFISDNLINLLGFSDKNVEEYLSAVSKSSRSGQEILNRFKDFDIPITGKSKQFANELFDRSHGSSTSSSAKPLVKRKTNAELLQESKSYSLLLDDNDDDDSSKRKKRKLEKSQKRKKHSRKATDGDDGDDDTKYRKVDERTEHEKLLSEFNEFVGGEEERMEYEEHLKKRDEERTKKVNQSKKSKDEIDFDTMSAAEKRQAIERMRELSRRHYLEKREEKELDLLQFAIKDEEFLYSDVKLTEKEQQRQQLDKQILEMAKKRVKGYNYDANRYNFPDTYERDDGKIDLSKREEAMNERYIDEEKVRTEQEEWEEYQSKAAKIGRTTHKKKQEDEYDYVFEDQIDFISHEILDGKQPDIDDNSDDDSENNENKKKLSAHEAILEGRKLLPIFPYRTELLQAIKDHVVIIVVGETGSGKTTQIPQYLHEEGYSDIGCIGCTQPRRVAAMSVAARVAQEVNCKLGNEVGYSIRFEDCTSDKTKIKYMTDGMLLREFLTKPDLADYSCMMVDEAHERTLHTDILFGLLKDIIRFRTDMRLIISSATLDAEKFSEYFDDAPIFNIPGRRYPVNIMYTKAPEADYLDAAIVTTLQIHITQELPGDILIFYTGQEEIETSRDILMQRTRGLGTKISELIICPIYSTLPSEEQAKVFQPTPPNARKVVLATNIAETSLTIDGIRYVVDTGFCKQTSYNPRTGMESLIVTPVSQAGAMQRAGRAGRTAPGKCFRLYTAWSFKHELDENTIPEIQRTNLSNVVLMLKSLGINDLIHFDFMDPPPAETLIRSLEQLYALGALNDEGLLTKLGRRMAEFPTDPQLAKMLLAAEKYKCTEEALTICAMLDVNSSVYYRPNDKAVHADNARLNFARGVGAHGDHMALMNIYTQWKETNFARNWCFENFVQERSMSKARDIRDQLESLCDRVELEKLSNSDPEQIRKAITAGYFYHTAKLQKDGKYRTIKNAHTVNVHPSSSLYKIDPMPRWLVYHQLQYTKQEYMRQIIEIKPEWLIEIAPHYYNKSQLDIEASKRKLPLANAKNSVASKS